MKKDLYEILGVKRTATPEEIKKAYKKQAQLYHPDMHADATDSEKAFYEEEFKKINNAHEILSNAAKRAEYDRELAKKEERRKATSSSTASHNTGQTNRRTAPKSEPTQKSEPDDTYEPQDTFADILFDYLEVTKEKYKKAWEEVRRQEQKYPFKDRHKEINKELHKECKIDEDKISSKIGYGIYSGIMHVTLEFIHQLGKLRYAKTDGFPKFVIRNRKFLATVLATAIFVTSAASQSEQAKDDPQEQVGIEITTDDEEVDEITIYRKYTIDFGDTASVLAQDANCTVSELCRINGISNSSFIYQGDNIIIPYYYNKKDIEHFTDSVTIEDGRNIEDIAEEYNTTPDAIRELNEEAINADGDIMSSTILVPNFISKNDLTEKKATSYVYS